MAGNCGKFNGMNALFLVIGALCLLYPKKALTVWIALWVMSRWISRHQL